MSAIKYDEPFTMQEGKLAQNKWFIPESMAVDAKMLHDIGTELWNRQVHCEHIAKLPGGSLVKVTALTHRAGPRALELLQAFTECVDMIIEIWNPDKPFRSYEDINTETSNRWPEPQQWIWA